MQRLEENLGAADVKLTAEDLGEIDGALANIKVIGNRYPEAMERLVDRRSQRHQGPAMERLVDRRPQRYQGAAMERLVDRRSQR